MKLTIDLEAGTVSIPAGEGIRVLPLASAEGFHAVSQAWLRAGWDAKHVYGFSWLGRPIIQLPEDMFRIQEVIHQIRPDVIVETGVAHGGSLIFYASLFEAMGYGRVIGVDIEIRPHNRAAIEAHPLFRRIQLLEGSSIDAGILAQVHGLVQPGERVLVMLDSNHTRDHVLAELRGYADLVGPGSYLVAADGIMKDLAGAPRSKPDWTWNNPHEAAQLFLRERDDFVLEVPERPFNEGTATEPITYWPGAWLKRVR